MFGALEVVSSNNRSRDMLNDTSSDSFLDMSKVTVAKLSSLHVSTRKRVDRFKKTSDDETESAPLELPFIIKDNIIIKTARSAEEAS
jgi:hypothetical protein